MFAVQNYFDQGFGYEQQSYQGSSQHLDRYTVPNMLLQIHSENFSGWGLQRVWFHQVSVYPAWLEHYSAPTHQISVVDHSNSGPEGGMMWHRERCESAYQPSPGVNQEVSAFGQSHAEHARKLYLSRATNFSGVSRWCTIPQYCQTLGSNCYRFSSQKKRAQNSSNGGFMFSRSRKARPYDPIKRRAPSPPKLEPDGPILKIATISKRPLLKKSKTQAISWQQRSHKYNSGLEKNKSRNFLENETKDNKGATAFQILCEISKSF